MQTLHACETFKISKISILRNSYTYRENIFASLKVENIFWLHHWIEKNREIIMICSNQKKQAASIWPDLIMG